MDQSDFIIKRTSRDVVLIRKGFGYEYHAHFNKYDAAIHLIKLLEKKQRPRSPYLLKAARRLTTDQEFNELSQPRVKQPYKNNKRKVS